MLKAEQNLVDKKLHKFSDSDIGSEYFRDVTFRLAVGEKLSTLPHVTVQVSILYFSHFSLCFCDFPCNFFEPQTVIHFQSISGSGSIKIAAETISQLYKGKKIIYIPNPSWAYHAPIFSQSGISTEFYRYYDERNKDLDHSGMMTDLTVSRFQYK